MTEPRPAIPLADLYRNALEEYRFQVQLNWDRTKFFILLNATILGAAAALLQLDASPVAGALLALLFLAGAFVALLGVRGTRKGKLHHRSAIAKKTLVEDAAGLVDGPPGRAGDHATFALGAMSRRSKMARILADVDAYVTDEVRGGSITGAVTALLWAMLALDVAGACLVANALLDCPLAWLPCEPITALPPAATPP